MAKGFFVAQVVTSRGAIPVEGASVSILPGGKSELIAFRVTDGDGKTSPVTLEAPPQDLANSPSDATPFAAYDLRIEHPLYVSLFVRDAQVFAGRTSLQEVEMIPLSKYVAPDSRSTTITVPPQEL